MANLRGRLTYKQLGAARLAGLLAAAVVAVVVLGLLLALASAVRLPTLTDVARALLGLLGFRQPPAVWVAALAGVLGWVVVTQLFMLPMVTYQIYALRKVMGFMQARVGPTRVGPMGLLQTPADVLKLLSKEDIIPQHADRAVFTIAPFMVLVPAMMAYLVIPFGNQKVVDGQLQYSLAVGSLNIGVLYIAAISSVAVIGVIAAGWASNNKYALLGSMRSAAQLVTYEVPLTLALVAPVIWVGSLNLSTIAAAQHTILHWTVWPCFISALLMAVCSLAELGHVPFDLPEAESELVSGYNVEYSGMKFAMFFLAEFSNAFVLAAVGNTLFFGGWHSPLAGVPILGVDHGVFALIWFFAKTFALMFCLFWLRATLPRLRIDQLMGLGWQVLIPLGVLNLVLVAVLKVVVVMVGMR